MKSPLHPPLCGGLFRCCRQQLRGGSRVAAAFPRASRRPGGRRSARRRTIPRRRSAAPSGCRRCPFVGCGLAANARAALPAALVLAGSGCVLGSGFFLFARAGQRQRAQKKDENLPPAQNLRAKSKKPLCSSIQYVAALAGNQRTIETKKRQNASSLKSRDPGTPPMCRLRREQRQLYFVVSGGPFLLGWVGLGCC